MKLTVIFDLDDSGKETKIEFSDTVWPKEFVALRIQKVLDVFQGRYDRHEGCKCGVKEPNIDINKEE